MIRAQKDKETIKQINQTLEGTDFKLISFDRNDEFFGNMIAVIKSSKKKYTFVSDRDDIFCNDELVIPHGYHIAGIDDTPTYFVKAIRETVFPELKEDSSLPRRETLPWGSSGIFWMFTDKGRMMLDFKRISIFADVSDNLLLIPTGYHKQYGAVDIGIVNALDSPYSDEQLEQTILDTFSQCYSLKPSEYIVRDNPLCKYLGVKRYSKATQGRRLVSIEWNRKSGYEIWPMVNMGKDGFDSHGDGMTHLSTQFRDGELARAIIKAMAKAKS